MGLSALEKARKFFNEHPELKTSDANLRPRDGFTYADLWDLLCEIMDKD